MFVKGTEVDIEDMIGRHCYISIINACYGLTNEEKIPYRRPVKAPDRVVLEVEEHFAKISKTYNHYTPSVYLTENSNTLVSTLPKIDEALNRFESLFKRLNAIVL